MPLASRYRLVMLCFIAALVLSGVTAFPLVYELRLLCSLLGIAPGADPAALTGLHAWVALVRLALEENAARYPFLAYGTDWLAFGHLTIALFFLDALRRPTHHDATLKAGMAACLGVIPLALICGEVRGIPFYWRLIDCSFGVLGILPLIYCLRLSRRMQAGKS